ncbi:hypothetical protein PFISCL1PPCAC_15035, partial [Pristionchus fissidentatus]
RMQSTLLSFLLLSLLSSVLALPTTVIPNFSVTSSLPSTIPTLFVAEATASVHPLLSQSTRSVGRPLIGPLIVTPVPTKSKLDFTNVDQTKN